jgi:hypothetical protein
MQYRFPHIKDASWNSYNRHRERYSAIESLLGTGSTGAEIGVYKGGFAEFLLPHCDRLYLVDPWFRLKPYWGEPCLENSAVRALINILTVYADDIDAGKVQVITDFSVDFLGTLKDGQLDWVYLDASHSYETTVAELHASFRVVRSGGHVIGDDFDPDPASRQHGVYRAVQEFARNRGLDLVLNTSRQWAFRVP